VLGPAATTRPAVEKDYWEPARITTLLNIELMRWIHRQGMTYVRLNIRIESYHEIILPTVYFMDTITLLYPNRFKI
jgi:hypothetical protein